MTTTTTAISDPIGLTTADTPPTEHTVSRAHLSSISPFFRDLLSARFVGSTDTAGDVVIPLAESHKDSKGFLMVLKDDEAGLATLRKEDWFKLLKCADKYDCRVATLIVERDLWELIATGEVSEAFSLALELKNEKAIQQTWRQAVDEDNKLEVVKDDDLKQIISLDTITAATASAVPDEYTSTWSIAAHRVICGYKSALSVRDQLQNEVNEVLETHNWPICRNCVTNILRTGTYVDSELSDELEI